MTLCDDWHRAYSKSLIARALKLLPCVFQKSLLPGRAWPAYMPDASISPVFPVACSSLLTVCPFLEHSTFPPHPRGIESGASIAPASAWS
jgi:hypothetical protein